MTRRHRSIGFAYSSRAIVISILLLCIYFFVHIVVALYRIRLVILVRSCSKPLNAWYLRKESQTKYFFAFSRLPNRNRSIISDNIR